MLKQLLRQCGRYYQAGDLMYHRLWREKLRQIGFRVISVEKLDCHDLWDIRLRGNLTVQSYLLLSKPVPSRKLGEQNLQEHQLKAEIKQFAKELGRPIQDDCIQVVRNGAYFRLAFIWPKGQPGQLLAQEKKPHAFSFLIRKWLRQARN